MKKIVILSLISVISVCLWSGTVMAKVGLVRNIHLTCGDSGPVFCFRGGSNISINPWSPGSPNHPDDTGIDWSSSLDGSSKAFVTLNINGIQCQSTTSTVEGPRRFYVLSIGINGATPIRIGTFNTECTDSGRFGGFFRLPPQGDNSVWFTEDLDVTVTLEEDDDMLGSLQIVLVGSD